MYPQRRLLALEQCGTNVERLEGDFARRDICNTTRAVSPNDRSFPTRASFYDKRDRTHKWTIAS